VSKPVVCLNDEPAEDDELWSALDYQDTLVSLKQP
jgi:hypothetical protein